MVGTELTSESHVGQQIRRALRLWACLHRVPVLNLFWNASRVAVSYIRRWEVHMLPSGVGGGVTKHRHELCPAEWVGVHVTAKSAAHKYQLAETSERSNCIVFLSFFSYYGVFCSPIASDLHFYNDAQRHADSWERLYFCPVHLTCPVFRVDIARFSR